jgi:hypothetical protein
MGGFIKTKYIKKNKDPKKNVIILSIRSKDSTFTSILGTVYLDYLNEYIRTKVQTEAKENVTYLDSQLVNIADPLLRTKILGLLANEIEKKMIVSREAFKVADPMYQHKIFKEKRFFPSLFGIGLFFLSSLIIVLIHAVTSSDRTEEDRQLLEKIKREVYLGWK